MDSTPKERALAVLATYGKELAALSQDKTVTVGYDYFIGLNITLGAARVAYRAIKNDQDIFDALYFLEDVADLWLPQHSFHKGAIRLEFELDPTF